MVDFACREFDLNEIIKCGFGLARSDLSIFLFLVANDELSLTTGQLSRRLRLDLSTVQRSIKRLHQKGLVRREQKNLPEGGYLFIYSVKDKREIRQLLKAVIQDWTKGVIEHINRW